MEVRTMQLTLPQELLEEIEELVKSGDYDDSAAVVAEAVLVLKEQRQLDALRAAVAIGDEQIERGDVVLFTPELAEELRQEALQMAREGRKPDPDVCP
jgi:antitoxin ParD1/3/4